MEKQGTDSMSLDFLMNKYSPFLMEARKRVFFTLSIFAVASIIGFTFYEKIISFLISLLNLKEVNIVFTSPFQFINLALSSGLVIGLIATLPLIISQILSFLKPALKAKEYRTVTRFLPFSILLFLIGFTFGSAIMKWQIGIFMDKSITLGIGNMLDISKLLSTIILTSTFLGVGFQFPIVLLVLMRTGTIKRSVLSKQRPWVYLVSFFFAMLLPADSLLADILMALPLVILFELTLLLDKLFGRGGNELPQGKEVIKNV